MAAQAVHTKTKFSISHNMYWIRLVWLFSFLSGYMFAFPCFLSVVCRWPGRRLSGASVLSRSARQVVEKPVPKIFLSLLWSTFRFLGLPSGSEAKKAFDPVQSHLSSSLYEPTRLSYPWNSLGKNSRVGSHSLLQGIFLTQRSNPVSRIAGRFFTIQ